MTILQNSNNFIILQSDEVLHTLTEISPKCLFSPWGARANIWPVYGQSERNYIRKELFLSPCKFGFGSKSEIIRREIALMMVHSAWNYEQTYPRTNDTKTVANM